MDFAVATIRCFDTTKVHHDKRWLRQQRLLVISTLEVLNCPWPSAGSKAMMLYELFAKPIETPPRSVLLAAARQKELIPTAAVPVQSSLEERESSLERQQRHERSNSGSNNATNLENSETSTSPNQGNNKKRSSSIVKKPHSLEASSSSSPSPSSPPSSPTKSIIPPLHLLVMAAEMNLLEKRYQLACDICGVKQVSFEDIKKVLNPSKSNVISQVTSTSLKGDDHLCISFKNDHPYFYNSPLAIQISKLVRTRFIAWSSARLVEGNFQNLFNGNGKGETLDLDIHTPQMVPASPTMSYRSSASSNTDNASFSSNKNNNNNNSAAVAPPPPQSPGSLVLDVNENVRQQRRGSVDSTSSPSSLPASPLTLDPNYVNSEVGYSRISELFQAGVIELPTNSDIDPLQPQIMLLAKALDWMGEPASVFAEVAATVKKLSDDTAAWSKTEATVKSGEDAQAKKLKEIEQAGSPTSRTRAQSKIVVGSPSRAMEFRERFDKIRIQLTENYLVSGAKEIVEPERSLSEKLAFWRSPRRIPQFDESDEAELVAELALQHLLFRSPATLKNLWADISVAYHEEMEHFGFNCRMLSTPCVPFAYFGIAEDFETVRFDLVRYHLQSLTSCKTPSAMLNAIVAAIKSVIVCVKAKYVLSKRWVRAFSEPPQYSGNNNGGTTKTTLNFISNINNDTNVNNSSSGAAGAYWSREEIDQIANEAKKHSLYNTDDILPIFIYIVVYCDLPQLLLYHRFLETLSFEGEASERAFYVTVFFSAIQWILDWKKPKARKNSKKEEKSQSQSQPHHHHHVEKTTANNTNGNNNNNNNVKLVLNLDEEDLLDIENNDNGMLGNNASSTNGHTSSGSGGGMPENEPMNVTPPRCLDESKNNNNNNSQPRKICRIGDENDDTQDGDASTSDDYDDEEDEEDDYLGGGEMLPDEVWEQAAALALMGTGSSATTIAGLVHLTTSGLKKEEELVMLASNANFNKNNNTNSTLVNFGAAVSAIQASGNSNANNNGEGSFGGVTTTKDRSSSIMRGPFSASFLGRR